MTKETYFEMCEQLGTTPVEEEIPIELGEFPIEIQQIFSLHQMLEDKFSDFSGTYQGKVYSGFPLFHVIYCEDLPMDWCLRILKFIDQLEIEESIRKQKSKNKVDLAKGPHG